MRVSPLHAAMLICLTFGLAGCSTTGGSSATSSWWPSALSFHRKNNAACDLASGNAPAAPAFASKATTAPTVTMPGADYTASAPSYSSGTQYPVTPYPPASVPGAAPAYAAGTAPASANTYAPTNPYAATTQNPAYTANGQYNSAQYPGGPSTSGDSPYAYR